MSGIKRYIERCAINMAETICKEANLQHLKNEVMHLCINWAFVDDGQSIEHDKVVWNCERLSAGVYKRIILGVIAELVETPEDYHYYFVEESPEVLAEIGKACRAAQQKYLPKK